MNKPAMPAEARDVLAFWFGARPDDAPMDAPRVVKEKGSLWWGGGAALDAEIRARFGALVEQAVGGGLESWSETPRGNLARVILLDQFTRNVYRGKAEAFVGDPIARRIALAAIDRGDPEALEALECVFLFMPLEHSEELALQDRCVALFAAVADRAPADVADTVRGFVGYAEKHRDIIARFGRFPHRNPILGRAHTAEEAAFLADGGPTFGQSADKG